MVDRNYRRTLSVCVHVCACVMHARTTSVHACVYSFHAYTFVFISSYGHMPQHAHTCRDPAYAWTGLTCACWVLRNSFFDYLDSFFTHFLIQLWFLCSLYIFLQVLSPFIGRGSTSCISSWYRALTDDTKTLVCDTGFKPIIRLILESSANGILVQTLVERWWDTTHTFHITNWEMTMTSHNFHWMTSL